VAYFSPVETDPNVVLRLLPAPFTTLMIMTEIDAAMRPYSTAVAPDSSLRKARTCLVMAQAKVGVLLKQRVNSHRQTPLNPATEWPLRPQKVRPKRGLGACASKPSANQTRH
jgi:hypothetical protein